MKTLKATTLDEFYKQASDFSGKEIHSLLPPGIDKEVGHFNVFDIADTLEKFSRKATMPYNRRAYFKISLIRGASRAEYADKVIHIHQNALLFASPRVPYHWHPVGGGLSGTFCIFTDEFMRKTRSGVDLEELPIFQPGGFPVFEIDDEKAEEITLIFNKIKQEIASNYAFKYDLLRTYAVELIHIGQKLQPAAASHPAQNATTRVSSLFVELLERQFPIESSGQRLTLRSAKDYAERLSIHVNHLNKALKESTGKTTTDLISHRIIQEAKILLKETDWNISEIAYSLGFEEVAHFSNFFRKQTSLTPLAYRS